MLRKLYDWTLAKSAHRHAERWLAFFAFLESSFFPIPPHPLLGLMCLARPERALRYGLICTVASVSGGLLGYAIGHYLYQSVGVSLLHALGLADAFPAAACHLREYGWLIILGKGATPIPFKLITITAGFIGLPLFTFLWASILSRGFQFLLVGALFWKFGATIRPFIERYLAWLSIAFVVVVIGGFFLISGLSEGAPTSGPCAHATLTA